MPTVSVPPAPPSPAPPTLSPAAGPPTLSPPAADPPTLPPPAADAPTLPPPAADTPTLPPHAADPPTLPPPPADAPTLPPPADAPTSPPPAADAPTLPPPAADAPTLPPPADAPTLPPPAADAPTLPPPAADAPTWDPAVLAPAVLNSPILDHPVPDPAILDSADLDSAGGPDLAAVASLRLSWDDAMAAFVPGMDSLERAIATTTEAALNRIPQRILDLGGGPGRYAERLTDRWPTARITLVDLDPVLLSLASTAVPEAVTVVNADLTSPSWPALTGDGYDLVTAVMAVHYLDARAVGTLYRRARSVLAPGGVLVIADIMPDDHLPTLTAALTRTSPRSDAWSRWWAALSDVPGMSPLLAERAEAFRPHPPSGFTAAVEWHASAARAAGFSEAGLIWRESRHAALAAH